MLVLPALFDEANKLRRLTVEVMRRLDLAEIDSVLPDLPGCNESRQPLGTQTLAHWRQSAVAASTRFGATHVLTLRGGALIAPGDMPGWAYAPVAGRKVLRAMLRARTIAAREAGREETIEALQEQARAEGIELAGWKLGAAMFAQVLDDARPGTRLVLDADALNLLARRPRPLPADSILTPHPGEAARLLGIEASEVQRDRAGALQGLCARYATVVVLKGAGTLVGATGRGARRISAGNPGMAVGGMGDVLAGTIAGLHAQGLEAADAAACGALLHACAGDAAAGEGGERGLLPADLMPWLRRLANPQATA